MPSRWITHVKAVAKERGIKFGEALKVAGNSYNKKTKLSPNTLKKKNLPIGIDL